MPQKFKILLIEDEKPVVKAYSEFLQRKGLATEIAWNGEEAMTKVKSYQPDLILLDIILPRKDGISVLQDLKNDAETENIPVIILTNLSAGEAVRDAIKAGTSQYLVKSDYTLEDIYKRIQEVLSQNQDK